MGTFGPTSGADALTVSTVADSGAGLITMLNADEGNRINQELIQGLLHAFEAHINNEEVRFILLRSNGSVFCLGMDFEPFTYGESGGDDSGLHSGVCAYSRLLDRIHRCPKTVVGLVEGSVKAGGVGLAAACDVVLAAETAEFELSELYWGLVPANVMPYVLSMRMPVKRAAYLVQTAACINAQTALHWGLVDEIHPIDEMEKALNRMGRRLMRLSPIATARHKSFIETLRFSSMEEQRDLAVRELVDAASSPEVHEAIKNFAGGELPVWFDSFRPAGPLCLSHQGGGK